MNWCNKYVGRFYDPARNSCWQLVREVERVENDFDLPAYSDVDPNDAEAVARCMAEEKLRYECVAQRELKEPIEAFLARAMPKEFDVAILTGLVEKRMLPSHCGVVAGASHLLHVEMDIATVCIPLKHPNIRHRVVELYRPVK